MSGVVFYSRHDRSAGVISGGFDRASRVTSGATQARVNTARDHWWRACRSAEPRLDPPTAAALAMRSASAYGVGAVVKEGLDATLGSANATDAKAAAEEGWVDWAWRKTTDAADTVTLPVRTVYNDAKEGIQTVYTDTRQGLKNVQEMPEKIAQEPGNWLDEAKKPIIAGVIGLTVLGAAYLLAKD